MAAKKALKRETTPMPSYIRAALRAHGLMEAYRARPPYQREGYVRWTKHAVREETREKRLAQMLDELKRGGVYMKMRDPERVIPTRPKRAAKRATKKKKASKRTKK